MKVFHKSFTLGEGMLVAHAVGCSVYGMHARTHARAACARTQAHARYWMIQTWKAVNRGPSWHGSPSHGINDVLRSTISDGDHR